MQNTGLLRRFGAILYDSLLLFAVLMLITVPFVATRGGEAVEPLTDLTYRVSLLAAMYLFFVGLWMRGGRTLGMQAWRMQLESANGGKASLGAASLRFFAAWLSWAPFGLGFLWSLWDRDKLAWHDRISGTRLVYYPKQASLDA